MLAWQAHGVAMATARLFRRIVAEHPDAFRPEAGAWGRQGCTRVQLSEVEDDVLGQAMTLAWQNRVSRKTPSKRPARNRR